MTTENETVMDKAKIEESFKEILQRELQVKRLKAEIAEIKKQLSTQNGLNANQLEYAFTGYKAFYKAFNK